jgi:hypothetical protein
MEKGKPVIIDQAKLAEMLDDIPATLGHQGRKYTATEDAFILAVWSQKKDKAIAAKKLGICESSLRSRYNELRRNQDGEK